MFYYKMLIDCVGSGLWPEMNKSAPIVKISDTQYTYVSSGIPRGSGGNNAATDWRFEVMDMDRNRVDKVLVSVATDSTNAAPEIA